MRFLDAVGADFVQKDEKVSPPLMLAVAAGRIDSLEFLHERGTDFNLSFNGMTLAHVAVTTGQLESLKFLYNLNTDLYEKDANGLSVVDLGFKSDSDEIRQWISSINVTGSQKLTSEVYEPDL